MRKGVKDAWITHGYVFNICMFWYQGHRNGISHGMENHPERLSILIISTIAISSKLLRPAYIIIFIIM